MDISELSAPESWRENKERKENGNKNLLAEVIRAGPLRQSPHITIQANQILLLQERQQGQTSP